VILDSIFAFSYGMSKFKNKAKGASAVMTLLGLVLVALFAWFIYQQFQSGSQMTLFGVTLPAWLVYGVVGVIILAIVFKFLRLAPPSLALLAPTMAIGPPRRKVRGMSGLGLIAFILAVIILIAYVLPWFGLSFDKVVYYAAVGLAIIVLILVFGGGGKKKGIGTVATLGLAMLVAGLGILAYYFVATGALGNVYTLAIAVTIGAVALLAIYFIFVRRGRGAAAALAALMALAAAASAYAADTNSTSASAVVSTGGEAGKYIAIGVVAIVIIVALLYFLLTRGRGGDVLVVE